MKLNFLINKLKSSREDYSGFLIILLFISLSGLFNSCEFNPTGVNYNDIKPEAPVGYMELNFNTDTLKVYGSLYLGYKIDLGDKIPGPVSLYLDGNLISTRSNLKDSVYFVSTSYSNSTHTLMLQVISNSGTGSIGDKLGAERAVFSKQWTVIIDNSVPAPLNIISAGPDNGRLVISWNRNNNFNFQHYALYRNGNLLTSIADRNITSWTDSSFVGGSTNYRIDVVAADHVTNGNVYAYTYSFPVITSLTVTDSNAIKLVWKKSAFYNSISNYVLYKGDARYVNNSGGILLSKGDTTYTDENPYFGRSIAYHIGVYVAKSQIYFQDETSYKAGFIGNETLSANSIQYVQAINSFYILNSGGLYRLEANNCTVAASLGSQNYGTDPSVGNYFTVSQNGQYAYLSSKANFLKIDPISLAVQKTIPTKQILGYDSYPAGIMQVSDSNYIGFTSDIKLQNQNTDIYMVDNILLNLNNNTVADSVNHYNSGLKTYLSANNKYFVSNGVLYGVSRGQLYIKGSINASEILFIGSGDKYMDVNSNNLEIRRSSDMGLIRSFNISCAVCSYDPTTGYIGTTAYLNGALYYLILNPDTGAEIKRIPVADNNFFMANSTLFSLNGYYLKLNLK